MLATHNENVEEKLVSFLLRGERTAQKLHILLLNAGSSVTLQAVYKSLKKLLDENVVVKHRKYFAVNKEWIQNVQKKLGTEPLMALKEGDRLVYTFSSFVLVDAFWKHIAFSIPEEDQRVPLFAYMPHNFWLHNPARFESETAYYSAFKNEQHDGFIVVGATDEADVRLASEVKNEYLRINTIPYLQFKRTDHIAVIGDYITTTRITQKIAERIDALYSKTAGEALNQELEEVFDTKTKIKLILENNPKKAKLLRKKIGKDFYIPKNIRTYENTGRGQR